MLSNSSERKIHPLPPFIVSQIRAGEVIEGPSSIIKEMVENSLDAKSSSIEVIVENNGLSLIKIIDNGEGISHEDLPFAFNSHSTSKIKSYEDLFSLYSYGFRGEALASISSIAKVTCYSRTKEESSSVIVLEEGEVKKHTAWEINAPGTTMIVEDLFYNTPVRLKFLKSKQVEKNKILKIMYSYILSFPQVSFSLRFDDEDPIVLHGQKILCEKERIFDLLLQIKKNKKQQVDLELIDLYEDEYAKHKLQAFLLKNNEVNKIKNFHFIFVNKRPLQDKKIGQFIYKLLEEKNILTEGYILWFEIPPDLIDVNIHPTKSLVSFEKQDIVYALLRRWINSFETEVNLVSQSEIKEVWGENQGGEQEEGYNLVLSVYPYFIVKEYSLESREGMVFSLHVENFYNYLVDEFMTDENIAFLVPEKISLTPEDVLFSKEKFEKTGIQLKKVGADYYVQRGPSLFTSISILPLIKKRFLQFENDRSFSMDFRTAIKMLKRSSMRKLKEKLILKIFDGDLLEVIHEQ